MISTDNMFSRLKHLMTSLNRFRMPSHPRTITKKEQQYLEQYASTLYSGDGEIVDLGCWLGTTTTSLAKGLNKNPNTNASRKKIHAFDLFEWEYWMDDFVKGMKLENKYKPGESFFGEFERRIKPWRSQVQIHGVDLCKTEWIGKEIEFLLIDAMKSWELAHAIVNKFYPYLIENKSYVLHQDFAHGFAPWIHLIHYRLRSYFTLEHVVPKSGSFVFRYVNKIPTEILKIQYLPCMFSEDEIEKAFDHSFSLVSDKFARANIAAAKIWFFIQSGNKMKANSELRRYLLNGLPMERDLKIVSDFLKLN